jgi:hypothetical protein
MEQFLYFSAKVNSYAAHLLPYNHFKIEFILLYEIVSRTT